MTSGVTRLQTIATGKPTKTTGGALDIEDD